MLDTNVFISALLNPYEPPADILRLGVAGKARLAYGTRILAEYREVAARPVFKLDSRLVEALIGELAANGIRVLPVPLPVRLPDADGQPFLEVAAAAGEDAVLITGNMHHFPDHLRHGVSVFTPRQWMDQWRIK